MGEHFQVGQSLGANMQACIHACQTCHGVCVETTRHCIKLGGKYADPEHLRLLTDCVQICQTSADFMLRDSDFHGMTCDICAEVCERCAEECAAFGSDDALMKRCAEACRMCAESCRTMVAQWNRTHL